jgi:AcrR family transcriptional regulator
MTPPAGRREANKQATRDALRQAAARLFAQQGYEATSIAQIASTAGVGERTFYRYFDTKDDLLAEQALAWIDLLHAAIRDRPAHEPPYPAVARAMSAVAAQLAADTAGGGDWILTALPRPIATLRRATPWPLRRLERSIADALQQRQPDPPSDDASATLVARAAVVVLRTAAGRHRELVRNGHPSPGLDHLLHDTFAQLTTLTSEPI